ncbi:MAG: SpoIIE family protein phosphatase [Candidatus Cloacimonetes bacterium]|nr:SpoIIE family protein phosphatase [Candidatus Cloacimonadota bacterium]
MHKNNDFKQISFSDQNYTINSINVNSQNNLMISSNIGFQIWNKEVEKKFDSLNGLRSNMIFDSLEDREGNIWLASFKGLSKIKKSDSNEFNYQIDSPFKNSNSVILSSQDTLYIYGKELIYKKNIDGIMEACVTKENSDFIFSTGNSIYEFNFKSKTLKNISELYPQKKEKSDPNLVSLTKYCYEIFKDKNKNIWVSELIYGIQAKWTGTEFIEYDKINPVIGNYVSDTNNGIYSVPFPSWVKSKREIHYFDGIEFNKFPIINGDFYEIFETVNKDVILECPVGFRQLLDGKYQKISNSNIFNENFKIIFKKRGNKYLIKYETKDEFLYNDANYSFFIKENEFIETSLPFIFNFNGENYKSVNIHSNGFITFGIVDTLNTACNENRFEKRKRIAPLFTNLIIPENGISINKNKNKIDIIWKDVKEWGTNQKNTFSVTLFRNGNIQFHYKKLNISSALAGIANSVTEKPFRIFDTKKENKEPLEYPLFYLHDETVFINNETITPVKKYLNNKRILFVSADSLQIYNYEKLECEAKLYDKRLISLGSMSCEDNKGNLWFNSQIGFYKYDIQKNKLFFFDETNGFKSEETFFILQAPDSTFWVTYIENVFHFEDDGFYNNVEPTLFIDVIKVNNTIIKNRDKFTFSENNFIFEFTGVSLAEHKKVKYKTWLEGWDNDWSVPVSEKIKTYKNLLNGNYVFKVISCNNDGLWNKKPAEFSFTILPPWYKTWWFYTVLTIFIISLLYSLYKARVRILEKTQKKLEKEVETRTYELSNANIELEEQSTLIIEKNTKLTDSIEYASLIQNSILPREKEISQYIKNYFIIWKPKDVVGGDFYWFFPIPNSQNYIISVIDCTGHGVPGAFMSMTANSILNNIVREKKIYEPDKILNLLHKEIRFTLRQQSKESQQDGMDILDVRR